MSLWFFCEIEILKTIEMSYLGWSTSICYGDCKGRWQCKVGYVWCFLLNWFIISCTFALDTGLISLRDLRQSILFGNLFTSFNYFSSGRGPQPAPTFIGNFIAFILNLVSIIFIDLILKYLSKCISYNLALLNQIGPKGLEFARYSLDYHTIRNYLYTNRTWGKER